MMGVTHILLGTAAACALTGDLSGDVIFAAAVGSLLPDIDSSQSFLGQVFFPISHWLELRDSHRGFTHSYLCLLCLFVVCAIGGYIFNWRWELWMAAPIGFFVSMRADTTTKSGSQLFWPNRIIWVMPLNPNIRLETGKKGEWILLVLTLVLWIGVANVASAGGLSQWVGNEFMGSKEAAQKLVQNSDDVYRALVSGQLATGEPIRNRQVYLLETEGSDLILAEESGRILTFKKIDSIRTGEKSGNLKLYQQRVAEADAIEWANQLPPGSYILGELRLDPLSAPQIPIGLNSISGAGQIRLNWATAEQVKSALADAWIEEGEVNVKVWQR